jgi:hypothetical protein
VKNFKQFNPEPTGNFHCRTQTDLATKRL